MAEAGHGLMLRYLLKPMRAVFQNILLLGGGILLALILLEGGARWLPLPFAESENRADVCSKQLGWRGRPFFETTAATGDYVHDLSFNQAGMHDTEHELARPDDTFRILMLGDSFVQAHQVREAETAHQVLEELLNRGSPAQNFEVISAGVGGWGSGQQLLYYRTEGRLYQPDLVLLMFFIGNDVKDNLPGRGITAGGRNCYSPYFVLCGDRLDPEPWLYAPGIKPPTGDRCGWGQKLAVNSLGRLYQSSRLYVQLEPLVAVPQEPVSMLDFYIGRNELFDYAFRLTVALVKQLETEVRQDGAEFRVVLVSPVDLVVFARMSAAEREAVYRRIPAMSRAEEMAPPNQELAAEFSRAGIEVLDLLPVFVRHMDETGEALYFEGDKHWNVAGNRLAAEAIYEWLE